MPRRSWEVRIADIAEAIETVLGYTSGMTFEQFVSDRKTVDAVIRNLIVIGEAEGDQGTTRFPDMLQ